MATLVVCFFAGRRGVWWCDALRFSGFLCSRLTLIVKCFFYTVGSKFGLYVFRVSIGLFVEFLWSPTRPECALVWVSLFDLLGIQCTLFAS